MLGKKKEQPLNKVAAHQRGKAHELQELEGRIALLEKQRAAWMTRASAASMALDSIMERCLTIPTAACPLEAAKLAGEVHRTALTCIDRVRTAPPIHTHGWAQQQWLKYQASGVPMTAKTLEDACKEKA